MTGLSEQNFRTLVDSVPFGIAIMTADKKYEYLNPKFIDLFGYSLEDIPDGRAWLENAYPDKEYRTNVISVWKLDYAESRNVRELSPQIFRVRCKDGHYKSVHFRLVRMENGKQLFVCEDITAQKEAEDALKESEVKYRSLVDNLNVGVYRNLVMLNGKFVHVNSAMANMFGYNSIQDFMEVNASDLYNNPEDSRAFVRELVTKGFLKDYELLLRKKDGSSIWCSCTAMAHFRGDKRIEWIDGILEDITLRKKHEEQLKYMASHDPLTGLYNRMFFLNRLEEELKKARDCGYQIIVGLLDLDGFKQVNDKYGHETGDQVLKDVSARLNRLLPDASTISRYGGNEFIDRLSPEISTVCRYGGDEFVIMLTSKNTSLENLSEAVFSMEKEISRQYDVLRTEIRFDFNGKEITDKLKKIFSERLNSSFRNSDYISRYERDTLRITFTREEIPEDKIDDVFNEISAMAECPFEKVKAGIDFIGCSIGVSIFPNDASDFETLIKHADRAMYNVKMRHKQEEETGISNNYLWMNQK